MTEIMNGMKGALAGLFALGVTSVTEVPDALGHADRPKYTQEQQDSRQGEIQRLCAEVLQVEEVKKMWLRLKALTPEKNSIEIKDSVTFTPEDNKLPKSLHDGLMSGRYQSIFPLSRFWPAGRYTLTINMSRSVDGVRMQCIANIGTENEERSPMYAVK